MFLGTCTSPGSSTWTLTGTVIRPMCIGRSLRSSHCPRLEIAALMDVVMISEREGVRKPDREIFDRALRRIDLPAEDTWYVGDHPEIDVAAAAAAGLSAVWKRTSYWPAPAPKHRQIDGMADLLTLVGANE